MSLGISETITTIKAQKSIKVSFLMEFDVLMGKDRVNK